MSRKFHTIFVVIYALVAFSSLGYAQQTPPDDKSDIEKKPVKKANSRPEEPARIPEPFDDVTVETMATKCVKLTTGRGDILLEMFPESAPNTVRNFLNLVSIKALENTTFSRIVPNFVIQGGDLWTNENATNDIKWRASRKIADEPNLIKHEIGIVSMARGDEPNTASTNFFILLTDYPGLDGKFAAFGKVTSGMDVVETINKMPVDGEKPKEPVRINSATIFTCEKKAADSN